MKCLLCKKNFSIGDKILKLIHSKILSNESFEFSSISEEGIIHNRCLSIFLQQEDKPKNSSVERTDILDFVEKL